MIDIGFFDYKNPIIMRSGMEYIDYQDGSFYRALTALMENIYNPAQSEFDWTHANRKKLDDLIKAHTGLFTITTIWGIQNWGIEAGFISPGNVLNSQNIEKVLSDDKSAIGLFYRYFKEKSLTGWCDLKTGKVEGDFQFVPFTLYVPKQPDLNVDLMKKMNKPPSVYEVAAAAILHECGHAFFGLHQISSSILEDIFFTRTAAEIKKAQTLPEKLTIVKAFEEETHIDISKEVKEKGEATIIGFKQGLADRDYRRALSLGATNVTPEILANAYAVRMGAGLAIAGFFTSLGLSAKQKEKMHLVEMGIFAALLGTGAGVVWIFSLMAFRFVSFIPGLRFGLANGSHETLYRTIKSILRDTIDLLRKADKEDNPTAVKMLLEQARVIDKMADAAKPSLEDTFVQRAIQGLFAGRQEGKRENMEYYTAELNYNPLSIYTTQ